MPQRIPRTKTRITPIIALLLFISASSQQSCSLVLFVAACELCKQIARTHGIVKYSPDPYDDDDRCKPRNKPPAPGLKKCQVALSLLKSGQEARFKVGLDSFSIRLYRAHCQKQFVQSLILFIFHNVSPEAVSVSAGL